MFFNIPAHLIEKCERKHGGIFMTLLLQRTHDRPPVTGQGIRNESVTVGQQSGNQSVASLP